jgi:hypothetical protein
VTQAQRSRSASGRSASPPTRESPAGSFRTPRVRSFRMSARMTGSIPRSIGSRGRRPGASSTPLRTRRGVLGVIGLRNKRGRSLHGRGPRLPRSLVRRHRRRHRERAPLLGAQSLGSATTHPGWRAAARLGAARSIHRDDRHGTGDAGGLPAHGERGSISSASRSIPRMCLPLRSDAVAMTRSAKSGNITEPDSPAGKTGARATVADPWWGSTTLPPLHLVVSAPSPSTSHAGFYASLRSPTTAR